MVATPFAGTLIDRFGGRAVLIVVPLSLAAGYALFVVLGMGLAVVVAESSSARAAPAAWSCSSMATR